MITYVRGNIFESPASTLVNTVNTVGVMGKGIAYEFKRLYPDMFGRYRELCERGELQIGRLWLYKTEHKSVLNFPTKEDWRRPSKPEYIESGLRTFVDMYEKAGIHSVAFPALGCGHGGLDFKTQVQPLMERWLSKVAADVFIYPHRSATCIPEHRDVKKMSAWLRHAPEQLAFPEVWEDLRSVLARKREFTTFKTGNKYRAEIIDSDEQRAIRVIRRGGSRLMSYDDLLDFWQQLRAFGFTSRLSARGDRSKNVSYIAPIFAELDYVKPVRIYTASYADDTDFEQSAEYALQIVPRSMEEARDKSQLNLIA